MCFLCDNLNWTCGKFLDSIDKICEPKDAIKKLCVIHRDMVMMRYGK